MATIVPKVYRNGIPEFDTPEPYITIQESVPSPRGSGTCIKPCDLPWKCCKNGDIVDGKQILVLFEVEVEVGDWDLPEKPPKTQKMWIPTFYIFHGLKSVQGLNSYKEEEIIADGLDKIYKGLEGVGRHGEVEWTYHNYICENLKIYYQEIKTE